MATKKTGRLERPDVVRILTVGGTPRLFDENAEAIHVDRNEPGDTLVRWVAYRKENPYDEQHDVATRIRLTKLPWVGWFFRSFLGHWIVRFLRRRAAAKTDVEILRKLKRYIKDDTLIIIELHNSYWKFIRELMQFVVLIDRELGWRRHPENSQQMLLVEDDVEINRIMRFESQYSVLGRMPIEKGTNKRLEQLKNMTPERWLEMIRTKREKNRQSRRGRRKRNGGRRNQRS